MQRRRTLTIAFYTVLALLVTTSASGQLRGDFFVSPLGNDRWSGKLSAPNRSRTDGPFATISKAQSAVRDFRANHPALARPVTVFLRGGTYMLPGPLLFGPEDSGNKVSPSVYAAAPGERPVLSGGRKLTGWNADAKGWWHLTLPAVSAGKWSFQQLFVNGKRRYRPRFPKSGYYTIDDALPPSPAAGSRGFDRFRFREGEIKSDWHNLQDVEILAFQTWTMARLRVKGVDAASRTVSFTGTTNGTESWSGLPRGNRYLVENAREALTEPGEFYLDRSTGELTYIPNQGEDPSHTSIFAPRLETLLELRGDVQARKWVEHVRFRGITFAHTNWVTPAGGYASPQAEASLGAAVEAVGARDCLIDHCTVTHAGTYAIELGEGCKRNGVVSCRLTDLGAGGVKIGLTSAPEDDERVASDNRAADCLIAHGGRVHPAAVGVWIGHSHHNNVIGNEIADLYYTGVSVGWSWGYGRSLAHDNLVERNHIHDIGQGVLSDMGGIYTLGLSPGSALRLNRIHDVESFDYGGWGIYPDEGTTNMLIENNVAFRCKSAPFHQHYGKENVVQNNVLALGRTAQLMRTREEEHISFSMLHNIVYWKEGVLLGSNWTNGKFRLDENLYWNAGGQLFNFAGKSLDEWRKSGQDQNSIIADPLFVDPDHGDFNLKPQSPAERIGFHAIAPSVAGPPARSEPLAPPAYPTAHGTKR